VSKPSYTIIFEDNNRKEFQEELKVLIEKHNGRIVHYKTINEEDNHAKSKFNKEKTSLSTPEHSVAYTYRED
jgi:hypothetical protein|tara:strand:- start:1858 stop:2073 length:216 start_codon:yes stop_codon:yes gene_type:complete